MLGLLVAVVHLVSLPLGVAVLMLRARALSAAERPEELKPVLFWDNIAGLIALLWIGSGSWRAFGGLEKGSAYYLSNHLFWAKMTLLLVVLALESIPMATFIGWRVQLGRKRPVSLARKAALVKIHWAEFWAILGMVMCAVLMARGVGN